MQQRTSGFLLIIVGVICIAFTGYNMITREKVADIGGVHISRDVVHTLPWLPIIGLGLFVFGFVLVVRDYKHRL